MGIGDTIRVGEEAWGVGHGKGLASHRGKWEWASAPAGREAPVAQGSEPLV